MFYSLNGYPDSELVKIMLSFALLLLKRDPTFIAHKFWILEFGFKVRLWRINLIKNDRAKRYNKSAIQNLKLPQKADLTE
jgi:hypothetical protein